MNNSPRKPKLQSKRKGAAMVEMAVVLPIFFMVVLGIVEFGRAMMVGQLATNAAREGARLAILDGSTNTEVEDSIKDFLQTTVGVAPGDVTVDITVVAAPGNENDAGNEVGSAHPKDLCKVKVEIPFDKVNFIPGSYPGGKKLVGHSAMRHE